MNKACEKGIIDDMCLHCEYLYWDGEDEVYCKYYKNKKEEEKKGKVINVGCACNDKQI